MIFRQLLSRRKRIPADKHGIQRSLIDTDVTQAIRRLQKAGFESYLVGGAVRDLLLNITPKDFDISTAATPAEVRRLFRRSRIIGRRFRIVHLYFYRGKNMHIVEVTTFRKDGDEVISDESGCIVRDNLFGAAIDDAERRDFTGNALFYDPESGDIIDYVGGYEDIRRQRLRLIGSPAKRFRQDPVRLLRALRFSSKLNLTLNQATLRALAPHAPLLDNMSPSRLFDEAVKIFRSGAAADAVARCIKHGVAPYFLPAAETAGEFFFAVLQHTDQRQRSGQVISISFVIAALFWPAVAAQWHELRRQKTHSVMAMESALSMADFSRNHIVPRRVIARAVDLYFLQARFEGQLNARQARSILRNPLFDRAVAFAALRRDEGGQQAAQWWSAYHLANDAERKAMLSQRANENKTSGRRRRQEQSQ